MHIYTLSELESNVRQLRATVDDNDLACTVKCCGEIIDNALEIIKDCLNTSSVDHLTRERAKSYWVAHITCALKKEHEYLPWGDTVTVAELREDDEDDEEDKESLAR